jgi:SAM-dependent methyltransferase
MSRTCRHISVMVQPRASTGRVYSPRAMGRILDSSTERGVIDRLLSLLPRNKPERLRDRFRRYSRPVRLAKLRATSPISADFGYDRGTPIDRHYIERFLSEQRDSIRGHVLEVKDSAYTDRFGTAVARRDVLDVDPVNPLVTIIADLATANEIPDATFDCFILTQTLQYIYETRAALDHARRILKVGGTLLATVPAVSPLVNDNRLTDYWRFTPASCTELFGEVFGHDSIRVRAYGNVLTSIAFLAGLASEELTTQELETQDGRFSMLVCVHAVKK